MDGSTQPFLIFLAWVASSGATDCYWLGIPWCGLISSCGNDKSMRMGFSHSTCLLQPTRYCCPVSKAGGQGVILCEHREYGGDCISMTLRNDQACLNVDSGKNDWASSVNTLDGCVRLYDDAYCQGQSQAFYPGSGRHDYLDAMNDRVSSVGHCFSHDRPTQGCDRAKRSSGYSRCQFALDVLVVGLISGMARHTGPPNSPIRYYQTGYMGRVEAVEAIIERHHLDTGTGTDQGARNFARGMGYNNDDAGHIVASRLGGSGTDLFNIFPQSVNINRGAWRDAEADVANLVATHGRIRYNINLEYDSPQATRPFKIVYRVANEDTGYVYFINDLVNP